MYAVHKLHLLATQLTQTTQAGALTHSYINKQLDCAPGFFSIIPTIIVVGLCSCCLYSPPAYGQDKVSFPPSFDSLHLGKSWLTETYWWTEAEIGYLKTKNLKGCSTWHLSSSLLVLTDGTWWIWTAKAVWWVTNVCISAWLTGNLLLLLG